MRLEDHSGEIVRKAREHLGLAVEAAAAAAGIPVSELSHWEQSGTLAPGADLGALAKLLKLDVVKLRRIIDGWEPQPQDLSQWRELRCVTTVKHDNAVNCYLVWDEVTREAAVFDTGWDAAPVLQLTSENQLQLKHIFLTHSHEDHVAGLGMLQRQHPKAMLHSSSRQAALHQRNRANDFVHLGSLRITNRDCPGHAEDGVIYVIGTWPEDAPHVAIVGDTLYAGSMARGFVSAAVLQEKVREQIFSLPADTLLCPGHGPLTTVQEQKAVNPFF